MAFLRASAYLAIAAAVAAAVATFGLDDATKARFANRKPLDPVVVGNNSCFMSQGWFDRDALLELLPTSEITLPDDETLSAEFPGLGLVPGKHPFMLSFCHGSNTHDVFTEFDVPEQEELMFVSPVVFTRDGTAELCSWVPVLYLDSLQGVIGGLYYGLRKEYHPAMQVTETATSKAWKIDGVIDASFKRHQQQQQQQPSSRSPPPPPPRRADLGGEGAELPAFFRQTFEKPFLTISYRQPFSTPHFYKATVHPVEVAAAEATYDWSYLGAPSVASGGKGAPPARATFARYWFGMSEPQGHSRFFANWALEA